MDAICEANGVTEDHLLRRGAEQVRRVEMFMFNFPELRGLSLFTNLTSLSIMQQSLERIEGLEACAQLRHLWVVECRVRKMEGLGACGRLERLYLYGNAIRTVEGLDAAASSLNTLWLCDNDIEVVPDLGYLRELKELNLARNRVERCADATRECSKLVSLNVAANAIDSFKEVRRFGRLRALKELALSDPHWGANPVCRLSNYHTFALCAVPRLAVLDTTPIAEETKALAEATAMKKTMFYEMRARHARRRADQAVAAAAKGEAYVIRELDRARVALDRAIRHTEKTLADAEEEKDGVFEASPLENEKPDPGADATISANDENALHDEKDDAETGDNTLTSSSRTLLASLESAKTSVLVECEATTRAFETCRSASRALADARDARARLELETGGNVRLEDGAPEAPWRDECAALARARFRGVGARLAGDDGPRVSGVRVVRVTRVHNRALRERFERAAARRADERLAAKRAEKRERRVERESAREKSARRGPSASDRGSSSSGASSSGSGSGSSESETTEEDASSEDASDEETRRGATEASLTRAGGTEGRLRDAKARARRARRREKKEDASERTELFFVGVPDEAASRAVAELGVPRDATAKGAVVVHDSLDLADAARLAGARARMKKKNTFGASVPEAEDPREAETGWMRGHAIVVRTRLGRAKTVETLGGSTVHASRFPGFDALTVVSPKAANQRSHYVFAKEDVVPEYVVEFQYDVVDADKSVNREVRAGDDVSTRRFREWTDPRFVSQRCESALLRLPFEARVVARPLARFLGAAAEAERARENAEDADDEMRAERDDASYAASAAFEVLSAAFGFEYDTHDSACRALDERLRRERDAVDGERWSGVADFARRRATRIGADAGGLTRLDLHGVGLTRVENLDGCGNLRSLVLAFNNISKLENLESLTKLEHLDVSHNALRRIENLAGLSRLNAILLSDNKLFRLEDLNAMRAAAGSLRTLDLRANAMRENRAYAGLVLRRMTALQVLDGVKVTERDRRRAAASTTTLTAAMIKAHATFDDEDVGFLASSRRLETSLNEKTEEDDPDAWWPRVQSLTVRRRDLRRLADLERLVNVRSIDLAQNEIARMEGLDALANLEKLNMEENRVAQIENTEALVNLRELNLARNRLCRVENLAPHLVRLTRLSLEGNRLTSLRGVTGLPELCELYVGENAVAETREVFHLKQLPKLVILDLAGNPVCFANEYRPYVLFTLRRVKVLDAVGVDAAEHAEARLRFAGRVTRDFLEVKFGRRHFRGAASLDLRASRLRDVGDAFLSAEFDALEALDLDGNALASVDGLCALPRLATLRVGGNKLEASPLWTVEALRAAVAAAARREERRDVSVDVAAKPALRDVDADSRRSVAALSALSLDDDDDDDAEEKNTEEGLGGERVGERPFVPSPLIRAARGKPESEPPITKRTVPLGGANALRTAEEVASEKEKEKKPETFVAETAESLLIRKPPFPALRVLDVSANAVANAATLRLGVLRTTLTTLDLSENDLTRLDGLETLAALETLSLDRNRVKHLEPDAFAGLGNLRVLRMEENGLRSLAHFDALVSLRALHLGGNRVGEVSELEKLAPLAELGELTLAGNPVTRKQVYRPMALRHCEKAHTLDGRAVTALEREHVEYLFSPVDGAGAASSDGAYGGDDPGSEGGNFIVASAVADAEYWRSAGTPRSDGNGAFPGEASNFFPRFPAESAFPALPARPPPRMSRGGGASAAVRAAPVEPAILNNGARLGAGGDGAARDAGENDAARSAIRRESQTRYAGSGTGSELRAELASAEARRAARDASERGRPRAPVRARVFGMGPIDSFAGADHGMHGAAPGGQAGYVGAGGARKKQIAERARRRLADADAERKTFREKFPPAGR